MLISQNYGNIWGMWVSLYAFTSAQLVYSFTSTLFTPALTIGKKAAWLQIQSATS
jgi:hypothetical protein